MNTIISKGLKVFFITLVFIFPIVSCKKAEKKEEISNGSNRIPVEVKKVQKETVLEHLDTFGVVEAFASITLSAEQEGTVKEIFVKEGDFLKSGELILRLDDRIYRAEKQRSEAILNQARSVFNRQKQLFEAKSISEKEYEDSLFAFQRTEAEYAIASTRLDRCEIRSPVDAHLDDLLVELGEYLIPGKPVARLEKIDRLKLVFFIPEKDISATKIGTKVEYRFDFLPEEIFESEIAMLTKAASRDSLAFRAELHIENSSGCFRPGMIAKVRMLRKIVKDAISIPLTSIIPRHGGHYVFVVKDDRAYQREVKISFLTDTSAVLSSGLSEGELLITSGNRLLREREPVQIIGEIK